MDISFQFSTTNDPLSKMIRDKTHSKFSHVDIVTSEGLLLGSQYSEPDGDGVRIRQPNYQNFSFKEIVTITATTEQHDAFWRFLYNQVGKPYDTESIIDIGIGIDLFHRNWRDDDSWFCSELAAAGVETSGILVFKKDLNWIDPQYFYISIYPLRKLWAEKSTKISLI